MVQVGLLEDNTRIARMCVMMLRYAGHHTRIARMCVMMLRYAGHQVTLYQHPDECLEALLAQPANAESRTYTTGGSSEPSPLPIDVLVLDLHLPDMDGVDVMRLLRTTPHTQTLPVILCSAAPPHEVARALRAVPRATFVEKPFTFQDLIGAIDRAVHG